MSDRRQKPLVGGKVIPLSPPAVDESDDSIDYAFYKQCDLFTVAENLALQIFMDAAKVSNKTSISVAHLEILIERIEALKAADRAKPEFDESTIAALKAAYSSDKKVSRFDRLEAKVSALQDACIEIGGIKIPLAKGIFWLLAANAIIGLANLLH